MKFIQSETLNKQLLNVLILLKDVLFILLKYLIFCTIGTLFLTVVKSESQMLKIISVNEIYIAPLVVFVIIAPSILSQFLKVPNGIELFKNLSNKIISNRRSLILYGILPLVHAYSVGIKALSQFAFGTVMTHFLQMFLTLLLMDFFIAAVKEHYSDYLLSTSHANNLKNLEEAFTPYGNANITSFTSGANGYINSPYMRGEIILKISFLLVPIKRKYILQRQEGYISMSRVYTYVACLSCTNYLCSLKE